MHIKLFKKDKKCDKYNMRKKKKKTDHFGINKVEYFGPKYLFIFQCIYMFPS